MNGLASNLVGHTINGWKVEEKLSKGDGTGGAFSSGYLVNSEADDRFAFMKAINIGYAMRMFHKPGTNRIEVLNEITEQFKHETKLLDICGQRRLNRVVNALDSGEYDHPSDPYFVPYIVFELCEEGDIRRHRKMLDHGLGWRLAVFHATAAGVMQLHCNGIYHQDLKPSNVLVDNEGTAKIADLGRATTAQSDDIFARPGYWGDPEYAPIEHHFNYTDADLRFLKKAADLYMLGGVLVFLVANVNFFSLVLSYLPHSHHPREWTGGFGKALPALRSATFDAIEQITNSVPPNIRSDVKELLESLCNPDPKKRGHPRSFLQAHSDPLSLERIVSIAARLSISVRYQHE